MYSLSTCSRCRHLCARQYQVNDCCWSFLNVYDCNIAVSTPSSSSSWNHWRGAVVDTAIIIIVAVMMTVSGLIYNPKWSYRITVISRTACNQRTQSVLVTCLNGCYDSGFALRISARYVVSLSLYLFQKTCAIQIRFYSTQNNLNVKTTKSTLNSPNSVVSMKTHGFLFRSFIFQFIFFIWSFLKHKKN